MKLLKTFNPKLLSKVITIIFPALTIGNIFFRNVRASAFSTTIVIKEPQKKIATNDRKSGKHNKRLYKNKIISTNSDGSTPKTSASLFRPVTVKPDKENVNFGEEFTGRVDTVLLLF